MNRIQINKSRMYASVDSVLGSNPDFVATMGDLVSTHERFKDGLDAISQNRQVQEANSKGLTKSKSELRAQLTTLISKFSAALMAYALSVKNEELKSKARYTNSVLITVGDPVFVDIGNLMLKLATPLKSELAGFFIGEAEFARLSSLLQEFRVAQPLRRVATSVSKVSTTNIGDMFDAQDKLLRDEMDILMLSFQFTHPDFYKAYKNARSIVGYKGRGKTSPEPKPEKTV